MNPFGYLTLFAVILAGGATALQAPTNARLAEMFADVPVSPAW